MKRSIEEHKNRLKSARKEENDLRNQVIDILMQYRCLRDSNNFYEKQIVYAKLAGKKDFDQDRYLRGESKNLLRWRMVR